MLEAVITQPRETAAVTSSTDSISVPPIQTVTETPLPPTPELTDTLAAESAAQIPMPGIVAEALSAEVSGQCGSECWSSLAIGGSNETEVRNVIYRAFGLPLDVGDVPYEDSFHFYAPSGTRLVGYQPSFPDDPANAWLAVHGWIGDDTDTLNAVAVTWFDAPIADRLSPQQILSSLGAPSEVRVFLDGTGQSTLGALDLLVTYRERGVVVYWVGTFFDITIEQEDGNDVESYHICLDDGFRHGYLYLSGPIAESRELTPIQDYLFGKSYEDDKLRSVEDVLQIDEQGFAEIALNVQHPCIET